MPSSFFRTENPCKTEVSFKKAFRRFPMTAGKSRAPYRKGARSCRFRGVQTVPSRNAVFLRLCCLFCFSSKAKKSTVVHRMRRPVSVRFFLRRPIPFRGVGTHSSGNPFSALQSRTEYTGIVYHPPVTDMRRMYEFFVNIKIRRNASVFRVSPERKPCIHLHPVRPTACQSVSRSSPRDA